MNALNAAVDAAIPLIERRLEMQAPFSEDNFRYLVFHGLFKSGTDVARMVLEYPHPNLQLQGKKIDTVLLDENGEPKTAIEFKYHRSNPSGTNLPRPMSAGELLADFAKLRDFPQVERFVVYLTDGEMLQYLKNPDNGLSWILEHSREQEISLSNIPDGKTFRQHAGDWSRPALSQTLLNRPVAIDHRLIVWQVNARD